MARVLILGGGERGERLGGALVKRGLAVRALAADEAAAARLRALGIDPSPGCARRLASVRGALEHVTLACWLFGDAPPPDGTPRESLHGTLLEAFVRELVDSPARALVYEATAPRSGEAVPAGRRLAVELAGRHAIELAVIDASATAPAEVWQQAALAAVERLLGVRYPPDQSS
jgi:hypothetical protein